MELSALIFLGGANHRDSSKAQRFLLRLIMTDLLTVFMEMEIYLISK